MRGWPGPAPVWSWSGCSPRWWRASAARRRAPRPRRRRSAAAAAACAAPWLGPSSPPPCWRPYADSSPFNQPIPAGARVTPDSARVVARLLGFGPLQKPHRRRRRALGRLRARGLLQPPGRSRVRRALHQPWGRCPVEGLRVAIPDQARVPGGTDGAPHRRRPGQRLGVRLLARAVQAARRRAARDRRGAGGRASTATAWAPTRSPPASARSPACCGPRSCSRG